MQKSEFAFQLAKVFECLRLAPSLSSVVWQCIEIGECCTVCLCMNHDGIFVVDGGLTS